MAIGETVITIVGNLTADPELRTTGQGAQVASFTIANTARVYNKQTGHRYQVRQRRRGAGRAAYPRRK